MHNEYSRALAQLLEQNCSTTRVRAIEAGGDIAPLWQALQASGFLDALVPEEKGGAGLRVSDVAPIAQLCGYFAAPIAIIDTMLARALLVSAGLEAPLEPIALVRRRTDTEGEALSSSAKAHWALVEVDAGRWALVETQCRGHDAKSFLSEVTTWTGPLSVATLTIGFPCRTLQAAMLSQLLAGAMLRTFELTLEFANQRVQFGKPIAKFQAIQHQFALMAEHLFAARMAAEVAWRRGDLNFDLMKIAAAKARTSEAGLAIADLAHAIHGAIGFAGEHDLQLFTRRLHAWRRNAGTESYWREVIGAHALESECASLDLLIGMSSAG